MKDIRVNKNDEVIYVEKEKSGKGRGYAPLPFTKLAAGHKSIIAMVGDILIRFYKQPQNSNVLEPKDLSGIVIIDELDLHLHPKWQRKLPILLSSVFPRVQFIVSTHSVLPFLGAPEKSIFLKVSRNKEEGIQVEHVDIEIKNLLPNTILTSAIFDLDGDEILQENNDGIDHIKTEDTFKEIVENDKISEELEAFEKSGTIPTDA